MVASGGHSGARLGAEGADWGVKRKEARSLSEPHPCKVAGLRQKGNLRGEIINM